MPGGSQVMLVVPEQVVQEAGDILALAGNTNTNTDWVKHHTIQHALLSVLHHLRIIRVQLGVLMRENISYRDEFCDSIMFPGLAASSQGLTRMLS